MIKLSHLFFLLYIILNYNILAQINTERFRADSAAVGFSGVTDVELTAITGNTDFQFINISGRLNYNWGNDYTFFVADGGFGWDKGERIFNQALAHLRHVQTISDFIQSEFFLQSDFNKKRLLDDRKLIGAGFRYRILNSRNLKLRLGTSYYYEYERFDSHNISAYTKKVFANRFSTYLTLEFSIKDDAKLLMISYFQPRIGQWSDYRILSDNSLIISLSTLVDLKVSFNLRYDTRPPETIKDIDTITKFGLGIKF